MARYLVVENEIKYHQILMESLLALDAKAQIEIFPKLEDFYIKLRSIKNSERSDFLAFDLYIIDLGASQLKDWKKIFDDFVLQARPSTAICLTGHDQASLTYKFLQQFSIYNFIFKPFDPLITKETIHLALNTKHPTQSVEMTTSQGNSAFVGIVKDIELQAISEIGFVTKSDVQIPEGSISKYLSPLFKNGLKESVWAQCISIHDDLKSPGFYVNRFQFFRIETTALNNLRKYILNHKQDAMAKPPFDVSALGSAEFIKMAIVGLDTVENRHYKSDFENQYSNLKVEFVRPVVGIIFDHQIVLNISDIEFPVLQKSFRVDAVFFLITDNKLEDSHIKKFAGQYRDVFLAPCDRSYLYKKVKFHYPELSPTDPYALVTINCHDRIKAANQIQVSEINELYLSFEYPRQLSYREFRTFVFLNQDEDQIIEIPAFCHFSGKKNSALSGQPPVYTNQFAFFGMTDR